MSKNVKKSAPSAVCALALERLRRASARREKRYANDRVVYAYVHKDNGMSDNLILLPYDSADAHNAFLERQIASVLQSGVDASKLRGYSLVKVGVFNKMDVSFKKCSPVVVVDIDDLVLKCEALKAKEKSNV